MTVRPEKRNVEEFRKPEFLAGGGEKKAVPDRSFSVLKAKLICADPEAEQESGESSEEMESPTSVGRWSRKKEFIHSQILRIREEDSHLGDDLGESFSVKIKEKVSNSNNRVAATSLDVVFFSRPILPCSPLGGKTTVKALN